MPAREAPRDRRGPWLLAAVALACVLTGCGDAAAPAASGSAVPVPVDRPVTQPMPRAEPAAIDIPKIGARSTLAPLGLNPDHTVEVPPVTQPMQAGWYTYGPAPGEVGPAVILGHVDGNKQQGIFYRLKELAPGDRVAVSRKDGSTANFVVRQVDQVDKNQFPTDAVYGDTAGPELRLITCGGSFDRAAHSYRDNIIVYASLE
ncbi:class F sortase [Amycolatopsis anabasis]|uniref:class F sortase n=1 Tax=Amycolatopsis anabasis TaxID=1840409 RepID=UPI00131D54E1|nr:class F sortase [Amycolatopsis anabasis]